MIPHFSLPARRTLVPVVVGVTLTALLASGFAWSATGKSATLSVDGKSSEVDFRGGTVADVLEAAGLEAGEHDLVVPSASSVVEDGDSVALRYGRELELVVDGKKRTVWVTASSVDEALDQVGLRTKGLALSASRSRGLPLEGATLRVTTPKNISIIADHKVKARTTTAPTVRAALIEAGVKLDGDDRLSHPRTQALTKGLVVRVVRMRTTQSVEQVRVPFKTQEKDDANLAEGETKTLTAGKSGLARRTVSATYADGAVEKRTVLSSSQVRAPVTRVLAIGTGASAPVSGSGNTASADGLNWGALANCESGGDPRAVNSTGTYRGLYQFSIETWQGVGGQGDPIDNSSGEQTYRAQLLYQRSGAGQWPECGRLL